MEITKPITIPVETVGQAYLEILRAWRKGCRSVTIFFDLGRNYNDYECRRAGPTNSVTG